MAEVPRREPSRRIRKLKADATLPVKEEPMTYEDEEEEEDKRLLGEGVFIFCVVKGKKT